MLRKGAAQFRSWWCGKPKPGDGTIFSFPVHHRDPQASHNSDNQAYEAPSNYRALFYHDAHSAYIPEFVDVWFPYADDVTIHDEPDTAETTRGTRKQQLYRSLGSGGGNEGCSPGVGSFLISTPVVLQAALGTLTALCKTLSNACSPLLLLCVLALLVPVTGDAEPAAELTHNPKDVARSPGLFKLVGGLNKPQVLAIIAFGLILVGWASAFAHMIPGSAVPRMPPAWSPDMAHRYPFRHWAQDVLTWSIAADGDPSRKAALLPMSLKGTAYEFCRTIPPMTLLHGGAINGHHVDPLTYVMHALAERFADLGEELRLTSITDLFNFARLGNERIDELITRFDLTRQRSFDLGQLTMSVTGLAYILLRACEVSDSQLMQLLLPLQGRFPNTEDEFQVLKTQLRRMGHIVEHAPGNIAAALRSRSSHPQYLATEQGQNNLDSQQSAFVAYGGAEQAHVSGAGGWGYGSDNVEGISSSIAQPAGGADAHAAYLAEMDSDGATDTDTASSTGMTEVPTATPEGWTDDTSFQEHLFWSYSRAKATWRKFMARPTRAVRRFTRRHISRFSSKGKGKRWPKGRPNVAAFLTSITDDEAAQIFAGFRARKGKGKGKGKRTSGKGKGRSQNPVGKDGQRMRCFRCGSETHLSRECSLPRTDGPQRTANAQGPNPSPNFYASTGSASDIPAQGPLADFVFMAVPSDRAGRDTDSSWSFATETDAWATYLRSRGAFNPPDSNAQSSQGPNSGPASPPEPMPTAPPTRIPFTAPSGPHPETARSDPAPPSMTASSTEAGRSNANPAGCGASAPSYPNYGSGFYPPGLGPNPCAAGSNNQAFSSAGVCPFPTAVVWAQSPPTMPEWAQMPVFGFLGPPRHVDPAHVPLIAQVSSLEGPMTQTLDSMATATQATSRRWLGEAMEGPGPQAAGSVATSQLERTQQGQIQTFHQAQQVVQTRRAQHRNRHRRIIQVPDTWDHQGYDALDDSCALCREVYLERDSVVRLVCRHLFHATCWAEYLMHPQARMSCPVCRGSARVIARFSYRAEYETPGPSQPTSEHQSRAPSADSPNQAPAESESGTRTPTRRPETFEMNTPPQATTGEEEAGGSPYNFEAFHANMIFPWWPSAVTAETPDTMVLHSTSHDEFQCILIDPGAYTNLAGLHWVRRLAQKCHALSLPVTQNQLNSPLSIAGVGNGTQQCTWSVRLPIAVPAVRDGVESTARCHFETPVVGGSGANLPALLGLRSLRAKNAILVLSERDEDLKLLIPGPGGWEYELSPGSVEHRLMTAPSGHLLMRCDLYEKSKTAPIKDPDVSFLSTPAQQESSHVEGTSGDSDFGHGLAQRPAQQAQSSSSTSFAPPSGSAFPVQRFAPGPSNLGE